MLNKKLTLILFIVLFSLSVFADVPPPSNEKRILIDLALTPRDDFADYRFFIAYGGGLEEISLKKDVKLLLEAAEHGGQQTHSYIIAIPKANLSGVDKLSEEQQMKYVIPVLKRTNDGYVELVKHVFREDVPKTDSADKKVVEIEVKRVDNLPKAFEGKGVTAKPSEQKLEINNSAGLGNATIIGGILITLAVLFGGVFLFRKSRKN
jgi:hypothetical protein